MARNIHEHARSRVAPAQEMAAARDYEAQRVFFLANGLYRAIQSLGSFLHLLLQKNFLYQNNWCESEDFERKFREYADHIHSLVTEEWNLGQLLQNAQGLCSTLPLHEVTIEEINFLPWK